MPKTQSYRGGSKMAITDAQMASTLMPTVMRTNRLGDGDAESSPSSASKSKAHAVR